MRRGAIHSIVHSLLFYLFLDLCVIAIVEVIKKTMPFSKLYVIQSGDGISAALFLMQTPQAFSREKRSTQSFERERSFFLIRDLHEFCFRSSAHSRASAEPPSVHFSTMCGSSLVSSHNLLYY